MVRRFLVTARLSFTLHISPPTLIMPSCHHHQMFTIPTLIGAFMAVSAIVVACYFIPQVLGACAHEEEEREWRPEDIVALTVFKTFQGQ